MRRQIGNARQEQLLDELRDNWQRRRFAECNRLLRLLGGGKGQGNRSYCTLRAALPTANAANDWMETWKLDGHLGGMGVK